MNVNIPENFLSSDFSTGNISWENLKKENMCMPCYFSEIFIAFTIYSDQFFNQIVFHLVLLQCHVPAFTYYVHGCPFLTVVSLEKEINYIRQTLTLREE